MKTATRSWPWYYALILIAAVVATRILWLNHDLWSLYESSTFTMAQQVLEGDVLYRDAADNRSPLMPYLKAAIFAVFGNPFAHPTDAGKQTARVLLPLGQSGKLKFQMNPGPYDSNAYDWAYWGPFSGETVTENSSQ
jgi:integral membrane sensor domain MASE1